ncbi:MAG TPA: nitrate- and nitrite sensing domain-containing protein [Streptosporangiaceae bacterium]|nr:nitrate- and nitrite sensing domain-containing protein [Streptosporangiaceae bacterium]
MGSHGVTHAASRADAAGKGDSPGTPGLELGTRGRPALRLRNWPVSWRLIAVIVLALGMGVTFGGLRVASAAGSAAQFSRVTQLARLGQNVASLVQALEDERDEMAGLIPVDMPATAAAAMRSWYSQTDAAAANVSALAVGVGGSFPSNIQADVSTARAAITSSYLTQLRSEAQSSQSVLELIGYYAGPIGDLLALNAQIAQGTADSALVSSVQTLSSLAQAQDEAAQQRALLFNALVQRGFAEGEQSALATTESEEATDLAAFRTTATAAEQQSYNVTVSGPAVNQAEGIEETVLSAGTLDTIATDNISPARAPGQWYAAMSATVAKMATVNGQVASSVVARSQFLQRGAEQSAVVTATLTTVILLLVLIATLLVARSLVRPLRRLRAGALDVATVHLPERVRQIGETLDPEASLAVEPIDVLSSDEIGQVARAFDLVHAEAVRLAGNQALLRGTFNAMFINLSRRSQSLIERLARTIDSLELSEEDPGRLASLFTMDHLVTRMRRNAENLLLLAGHESARKWNEPMLVADVARAAASEIEHYDRVKLNIQPGIAVTGQAVNDVAHLLAELIENATVYSPGDTEVRVSAQELASGGALVEISDDGVGTSEARLAQLNFRLDNPPEIDPLVARHMGLFAVSRLAERHGIRVRLTARSPRGLAALVWLPDSVIERSFYRYGTWQQPAAAQGAAQPAYASASVPGPPSAAQPSGSAWFRGEHPAEGADGPGQDPDDRNWFEPAGWAEMPAAAQSAPLADARPAGGDRTATGLPVRVPRANLMPGSISARPEAPRGAGQPGPGQPGPGQPAPGQAQPSAGLLAGLPRRSPEQSRSRLSGFQRGAQRAAQQPPPGTTEGADH